MSACSVSSGSSQQRAHTHSIAYIHKMACQCGGNRMGTGGRAVSQARFRKQVWRCTCPRPWLSCTSVCICNDVLFVPAHADPP